MLAFFAVHAHLLEALQGDWVQLALSDLLGYLLIEFGAQEVPILNRLEHGAELVSFRVIEKDEGLFLRAVNSLELESE